MTLEKFKIMIPEFGHDDFDDGYEVEGLDPEDACRDLMASKYSDWDYPEEMEFEVQSEDGSTESVVVTMEMEPCFTTRTLTFGPKQKRM